jgi:hypothetical protein
LEGGSYERSAARLKEMSHVKLRLPCLILVTLLAGCSRQGEMYDGGVYATRSVCPIVGVPAGTGDITLFNPSNSIAASAIDVSATITNVRVYCNDQGNDVVSTVAFDVVAVRRTATQARQVVLPFFNTVVQGGSSVIAKKVGAVGLNFAAGSYRAKTNSQATVRVNRAAAVLPANVRRILTRPRKSGQADAAVDPLNEPGVREAVARATFEQLVGFQLSEQQLRYNVTR